MSNIFEKLSNVFSDLRKSEAGLSDKLDDAMSPKEPQLPKHVYKDLSIPQIGNMHSFNTFEQQYQNVGVWIALDANGFDAINDDSGYEAGNEGMKNLMTSVAKAATDLGLKAFRVGGGTAFVHAPNNDQAALFCDRIQNDVKSSPMVAGKHKMSISIGLGYSKQHAENALKMAKQKLSHFEGGIEQRMKPPGCEENVFHSLLHENLHPDWQPLLGYHGLAPHEEHPGPLLPKDIKSPLKSNKG